MLYEDIPDNVTCENCGRDCEGRYSARVDSEGVVCRIFCGPCKDFENLTKFGEDGILTSNLTLRAALECHRNQQAHPTLMKINESNKRLEEVSQLFSDHVWISKMCLEEKKSSFWSKSCDFPGGVFRTLSTAGRVLFTFEAPDGYQVTLIAASGENRSAGVQGIFATEELAINLITSFTNAYKEGLVTLKDSSVFLG